MILRRTAEEYWADRVARSRYRFAKSQLRQVLAGQKKHPLPEPDGSALLQAVRLEESAARNDYVQASKIFRELLMAGEVRE